MVLFQGEEFDYSEFWFDDDLTIGENIPEHLTLEISIQDSGKDEPFHSMRLYKKKHLAGMKYVNRFLAI